MSNPAASNLAGQGQGQRSDPYAATPEDHKRAHEMHRAWDAYEGCFHGGDAQWPLLWKEGKEANPNILINRCGPAVDTDVAWLFGESVGINLPNGAPTDAQNYVDQAWGVNSDDSSDDEKMALLQELATNGAITGMAYLKIVWDEQSGQDYPQLVVLDSTCVRVQTDPHNCKIPVCYIIEYRVPDPASNDGAQGIYRQVIQRVDPDGLYSMTGIPDADTTWRISDYFKGSRSQTFALMPPDGPGKTNPTMWPYPWAPIDGCPHISLPNRYYGRPRITRDAIHINEAICTVASNINKIGIRHGHPVLYTVKSGNNQKTIRHEPGTILEVSSDIKAVEAHGDLANLMQFEEDLRADFDELTHVPAQAFGRQQDMPRVPVSGVAIRLGYGPLIADITKEHRTYGALITRVTQHMLALKNAAWAQLAVSLGWQDPLPADDLQQAQVIQAYSAMGIISKRTAANKAGLDWSVEQENMREEAKDALKAAMAGQSLLPPQPAAPAPTAPVPDGSGQPGTPADGNQPAQPGQPAPTNVPPVNHPAAVAQRAATAAVAKTLKGAR